MLTAQHQQLAVRQARQAVPGAGCRHLGQGALRTAAPSQATGQALVGLLLAAPQQYLVGRRDDGCEAAGQFIPFQRTKVQRLANGDPRLSAEERYGSFGNYQLAVSLAVKKMIADRTLLPSGAAAVLNDALTLGHTLLDLLPATSKDTTTKAPTGQR